MAHEQTNAFETFLYSLLPPEKIEQWAQDTGFIQRKRVILAVPFVLACLLALGHQTTDHIASMRRRFSRMTGKTIARSSFGDKLNDALLALLELIMGHVQQQARKPPKTKGLLAGFSDVVIVDATTVPLPGCLHAIFPASGNSKVAAAIKVVTVIRATTGQLLRHLIVSGKDHESGAFGPWLFEEGSLLLMDMAWTSAERWYWLGDAGVYFITRLRSDLNPLIFGSLKNHKGRSRCLQGQRLRQGTKGLKRTVIDVFCLFESSETGRQVGLRVVGIWNAKEKRYHFYVTNLMPEQMAAEHVAMCYRLRWEIELSYRLGKGALGLKQLKVKSPRSVYILTLCALLRATVAMQARLEASKRLEPGQWIQAEAFVREWQDLLVELVGQWLRGHSPQLDWSLLIYLTRDPNVGRPPLRHLIEHPDDERISRFLYGKAA